MQKGLVITKADGATHRLTVEGGDAVAIDRRIAEETAKFPDRRSSATTAPGEALWIQYFADPPAPSKADGGGFERALFGIFPTVAERNALLSRYPLFLWVLRGGVWADTKVLIDDALAEAAITQAQYDRVVVAAKSNNIPGF